MIQIEINKPINQDLLTEQLNSAYGVVQDFWFFGYSEVVYIQVPDGLDPQIARSVLAAHDASQPSEAQAFRSKIVTIAQSTVGVRLQDLTAAQIKSLMACLLYLAGGVDPQTMTVRPLMDWLGG